MKKLILILLSVIFFFGCSESNSDSGGVESGEIVSSNTISKVLIGNADNILVQSHIQPQMSNLYSASIESESGLKTITIDGLIDIEIEGGIGKTPIRGYSIKGSNLIKAAVSFQDASGDITTCIVDQSDNCTEIDLNPQKLSKFGNADYFREVAGKLYFRTIAKELRTMIASGIISNIAEDVEQVEFDTDGSIMYESGSDVILIKSNGAIISMDGSFWDGRNELRLDASTKKFFIGRKDHGFTFYTNEGYFGNLFFDVNEDPVTSHAQPVAWDAYINQGLNGVYYAVNTNYSPRNCNRYTVRGKDLIICGNEVFELGTDLIDLKKISFVWAGMEGDYVVEKIIANSQYLFFYMTSESVGNRLTIADPENFECAHLFSSADSSMFSAELNAFVNCQALTDVIYSVDQLTVTQNNTINFCGSRNGTNYIVQITNADTIPIFTETSGTCESIVSIQ